MLGHPAFRAKIREWLKVLRKKNCGVILATQSLSDAKNSGIIDILTETCPTKMLLANSAARQIDQSELYRDIGCNPALIDLISYMTPKQDYLLLQPDGRRVIQLALGRKELAFAVSDPDSISKIKELHAQLGDGWVDEWLRIRRAT
jgi:type IV secretion system protein VirB4